MNSALISYNDLLEILDDQNLVILDATFVLPNSSIDPYLVFQNKQIKGAQYFDVEAIADPNSHLPHMLPSPDLFKESVEKLGVSNNSKVIIYGQTGIALGPARAWWMFHIFGHENVYLLNGSLQDWENQGFPIITHQIEIPAHGSFEPSFNKDMVVDADHILEQLKSDAPPPIYDARSAERFSGQAKEPRQGMSSGHIPGSCNIPTGSLINHESGGLKNKEQLLTILNKDMLDSNQKAIMTCGSGVTACVIALAFYELGNYNWQIYDGSWSEWGQSEYPIMSE